MHKEFISRNAESGEKKKKKRLKANRKYFGTAKNRKTSVNAQTITYWIEAKKNALRA